MEKILIEVLKTEGHYAVSDTGDAGWDVTYHDTPEAAFDDVERRLDTYGRSNCEVGGDAMDEVLQAGVAALLSAQS